MHAFAALLLAAASPPAAPVARQVDIVVLGDGSVLRGHMLECSERSVRFVPETGGVELALPPSSLRSATWSDGRPCNLSQRSGGGSVVPGILALVAFPIIGGIVGSVAGRETCSQSEDQSLCIGAGLAIGVASGAVLGTVVLIAGSRGSPAASARNPDARPQASNGRSLTGVTLSFRF